MNEKAIDKALEEFEDKDFKDFAKMAFIIMKETGLKPMDFDNMDKYIQAVQVALNKRKGIKQYG